MKLSRAWIWASLLLVLQTCGCDIAHSKNSFYCQENIITDPSLVGEWQTSDSSQDSTLTISPLSSDSYTVVFMAFDKETKRRTTMEFEAHVFRFRNETYVDVLPRKFKIKGKNEKYASTDDDLEFYAPVHTAMRMVRDKDGLSFLFSAEVDASSLFKKEDEQAKKAREEEERRKRIAILTMSTEQLQREVLLSFPADQSSASLGMTYHRAKKPAD